MKKLVTTICCFATTLAIAGPELVSPSNLTIDFGASALAGTGRQIKIMNVPVVNNNISTATTYYNADLEFQFLADGRLAAVLTNASVASGPALVPSSAATNFTPGTYKLVANGCLYTMSNGGIGNDGSRTFALYTNVQDCGFSSSGYNYFNRSYSFSTSPIETNPYSRKDIYSSSYPVVTGAYGITSSGDTIRGVMAGTTLTTTGYSITSGVSNGTNIATFIKQ